MVTLSAAAKISSTVPVMVVALVASTLISELLSIVMRSAAAAEPVSTVAVIVAAE